MTKKSYPKRARVSRAPRPPSRRPAPSAAPFDRRVLQVSPPTEDHFALLQPEQDDHPVDEMVDRIPQIAARARRLIKLAAQVQRRCGDDALFLRYEDLRLNQQTEREKLYYGVGWEHGRLAGRAESAEACSGPAARLFRNRLQALITTSRGPAAISVGILLEYVRAMVLGLSRPSQSGVARSRDRASERRSER